MDMISDDDTDIDLDWQSYLETYHLLGEELAKGKEKQQVNTLLSLFFEFLMIVLLDEESDDDEPAARTFTPRTRACHQEGKGIDTVATCEYGQRTQVQSVM